MISHYLPKVCRVTPFACLNLSLWFWNVLYSCIHDTERVQKSDRVRGVSPNSYETLLIKDSVTALSVSFWRKFGVCEEWSNLLQWGHHQRVSFSPPGRNTRLWNQLSQRPNREVFPKEATVHRWIFFFFLCHNPLPNDSFDYHKLRHSVQ